jgi:N-acetylmuramoyl-L-alanine amidase CwlA
MLAIEKYQIEKNFIPGLPQIPFRKGVGQYEGVCLHATAVYGDTPDGERSYETRHWQDAFVHSFTDENKILQVADWNYISYGCCHTGNQFLLNFELCQDHDHNLFLAGYDKWVWQAAYALYQRKLGVIDKVTLWSHAEVSDTFKESDHQDPIAYLAEHGKTWHDVVNDVTAYYNQFEEEERMIQELQAQIAQLQQEVASLKEYNAMPQIPQWALEAVHSACNTIGQNGQPIMDSPEGRSYDLYAIMTILHRKGLI